MRSAGAAETVVVKKRRRETGLISPSYGHAEFSLSGNGTLVWVSGAPWGVDRNVVWIDRDGNIEVLANVDRAAAVRLAPGGERLALYIEGANDDIGIYDRERGTLTRLTHYQDENNPVWTSNGENVAFTANPEGAKGMFVASADGSSPPERLTESEIANLLR